MNKGELKLLDNHRLYCGDATNPDDVNKLIGDNEIGLLLTDPPYGIDIVKTGSIGGKGGGSQTIQGSNWRSETSNIQQGTVGTPAKPGFKKKTRVGGGGTKYGKVGRPRHC